MQRVLNIDWLEVYCLESSRYFPLDAGFYASRGFYVHSREYGTRQYSEMFTLYDSHGEPWIEIRRNPCAGDNRNNGIFVPESCHIRLVNRQCYFADCVQRFSEFLLRFDYNIKRIFRIDIACDFVRFDSGDNPQDFVRRYLARKYAKINQGNRTTRGVETWSGCEENYISWGAPKSMVGTKLYNKTKELDDTRFKDRTLKKPWIAYAWLNAGFIEDPVELTKKSADGNVTKPNVWRLEFSLRSSAREWLVIEDDSKKNGKDYIPHTLELYSTPEGLLTAFQSLVPCYFHFRYFSPSISKYKCKEKVLFRFDKGDSVYRLRQLPKDTEQHSQTFSALIPALQAYCNVQTDKHLRQAALDIIDSLRKGVITASLPEGLNADILQTALRVKMEHPEQDVGRILAALMSVQ